MNANSRFTVNGRNVSESEYVKDILFTCYMLHSGLREDDVEEIDIDGGLAAIDLIRGHLTKLEGLCLTDIEGIKVDHFTKYADYCEEILLRRKKEADKFQYAFIGILVVIFAVILVWFFK